MPKKPPSRRPPRTRLPKNAPEPGLDAARAELLGALAAAPPLARRRSKKARATRSAASQETERELVVSDSTEDAKRKQRAKTAQDHAGDATVEIGPIPDKRSNHRTRVLYIVDIMAAGKWQGYLSRAPLAEAWDVGDSRIRQLATEASNWLREDDPEQRLQRRQSLTAFITKQRERAANIPSMVTGQPDFGSVARLAELECKLLDIDIDGKRKVELTGKDGGPVDLTGGLAGLFAALEKEDAAPEPAGAPTPR